MSINELLCRQNTDNSIWNARRLHYNLQGNNHLYCNLINLRLQCVLYHYHNMLWILSLFSPTGVISGHGTHCPFNSLPFQLIALCEFTPSFSSRFRVSQSLVFCIVFCISLFVILSFFWPTYCLSFDLRLLITPLVSSNVS